ncbi:hypothetical protein BDV18DRAFT_162179 [Aspergillus unguis]
MTTQTQSQKQTFEVYIVKTTTKGPPHPQWSILLYNPQRNRSSLYTPTLDGTRYNHTLTRTLDIDTSHCTTELVATVPLRNADEFELECALKAAPGPSQHYVVRVLALLWEKGVLGRDVVRKFMREAAYSVQERGLRDGFYVKEDEKFYARVGLV